MTGELLEIIRVLQLTTYDEDEWEADNITVMRKALNIIEGKVNTAHDWLQVSYYYHLLLDIRNFNIHFNCIYFVGTVIDAWWFG